MSGIILLDAIRQPLTCIAHVMHEAAAEIEAVATITTDAEVIPPE